MKREDGSWINEDGSWINEDESWSFFRLVYLLWLVIKKKKIFFFFTIKKLKPYFYVEVVLSFFL
jgi:hypothetical protein